jgi:hypothetical protein
MDKEYILEEIDIELKKKFKLFFNDFGLGKVSKDYPEFSLSDYDKMSNDFPNFELPKKFYEENKDLVLSKLGVDNFNGNVIGFDSLGKELRVGDKVILTIPAFLDREDDYKIEKEIKYNALKFAFEPFCSYNKIIKRKVVFDVKKRK